MSADSMSPINEALDTLGREQFVAEENGRKDDAHNLGVAIAFVESQRDLLVEAEKLVADACDWLELDGHAVEEGAIAHKGRTFLAKMKE